MFFPKMVFVFGILWSTFFVCAAEEKAAKETVMVSVSELREYCASPLTQAVSCAQVGICVLTLIGVVVAVFCHCHVISKNTKAIIANHDLSRKLASMEAMKDTIKAIQPLGMRDKYSIYYDSKSSIPIKEILENATDVRKYLNALEALSIGVQKNIYDENTIREGFGNVITLSVVVFKEYIRVRQNNTHHRDCYEVLEWLAQQWEENHEVRREPASSDNL